MNIKKIIYTALMTILFVPVIVFAQTTAASQNNTAIPAGQSEFNTSAAGEAPPTYVLLTPLPCVGATPGSNCTTVNGTSQITSIGIEGYLVYVFKLLIALAVFLSVIMTIIGGFKYMTVESFTGKSDAKETIENAIKGLLLALASYVILYTINPNFVNISKVAVPKLNVAVSSAVQNDVQGLLNQPVNQTAIASDAALTSNKAAVTQALTALTTAQNNVTDLQNQVNDCFINSVNCTDAQYQTLQDQLKAAQQAVTVANNAVTTQSALSNLNTQIVQASRLVSEASTSAIQNSDAISGITANQANLQSSYNSAISTLTANGNNDPADIQNIKDTYAYASSTLNIEQAQLIATTNPDQALQIVTAADAAMANNGSTTLQQQYKTLSNSIKTTIQENLTNEAVSNKYNYNP